MRALIIAIGLVLGSLGIVSGAVFGLGDDEILVPPSESVAQEFVRAIALGQTGAAREMLTSDAKRLTSSADVHRLSTEFRARIGRLNDVKGTVVKRARDTTIVRARIQGERGEAESSLVLERESGEWAVARASDVLGVRQ